MRAEKMNMRHTPTVLLAIMLAACSDAKPDQAAEAQSSAQAEASGVVDAAIANAAAAAKAVAVKDSTPLYAFDYAYPAQAAAIAPLAAWLNADLVKQKRVLIKGAREGQAEAKDAGVEYRLYGNGTKWAVVTDLPGWLSLSAQRWEYSGGAHPNPWSESLVWDKAAGLRLNATDLFVSPTALSAAIRAPFCAVLDKQRAAKRGGPIDAAADDPFVSCIDPVESTVLLGSSDKAHFTRIGILVDPYAAGSYSEGEYEVTLPVTPALLRAVKPKYRSAFAVGR